MTTAAQTEMLTMLGVEGSPYSRKLRAVLRYRRIPYVWINQGTPEAQSLPQPKVQLLPQLFLMGEDGRPVAKTDTSPLIRGLESSHPVGRSVIPSDPALAFLDALVEDYADEWLTKAMFHYRWAYAPDIDKASRILPRWTGMHHSDEILARVGQEFAARQIGRLGVVGSSETTGEVIEDSYKRLLDLLERHLSTHRFLLGGRPGTGDFGIYGQLTQLVLFDPTSEAEALARAPRVYAWSDLVDDLSGVEPQESDWADRSALPATFVELLGEIGRVYAPFLVANARALEAGAERVQCQIDGREWTQKPFPYQGKCLRWLREGHAALESGDRDFVNQVLAGTGCEAIFA